MSIVLQVLISLIALQHLTFWWLEMFCWTKPVGRKVFKTTPEFAQASKALAANQGLYNLFLAAALILALTTTPETANAFAHYSLMCVALAGIYGAWSVSKTIFWIQALPALLTLTLLLLS